MASEEEKRRYESAKRHVSTRYAKHRKSDPRWRKRIPPAALFWLRQWRWQGTDVVDESFRLYTQCNVVKHDTSTVKRSYRQLVLGLAQDLEAEESHFGNSNDHDQKQGGPTSLQQLRAAEDEALSFQRSAFKDIREAGCESSLR